MTDMNELPADFPADWLESLVLWVLCFAFALGFAAVLFGVVGGIEYALWGELR